MADPPPVVFPNDGTRPEFAGPLIPLMQLSGEAVFVLEDAEVRLAPGDWLVVNGAMHSWRNDRDQPAVLVDVVIGAEHKGVSLRTW